MNSSILKFELVLAAALLCAGLLVLPVAIFWVGQFVIGAYEGDGGLMGLFNGIWSQLGQGSLAAWTLVLSPYVVIQLVRLTRFLLRRPVSRVTVPADNR